MAIGRAEKNSEYLKLLQPFLCAWELTVPCRMWLVDWGVRASWLVQNQAIWVSPYRNKAMWLVDWGFRVSWLVQNQAIWVSPYRNNNIPSVSIVTIMSAAVSSRYFTLSSPSLPLHEAITWTSVSAHPAFTSSLFMISRGNTGRPVNHGRTLPRHKGHQYCII